MISQLIGPISGLLDKFVEDKDQKAKLAHDIATMAERHAHEANMGQLEVNKTEAAHKSLFVSGWRPAVGWVAVLGMASNFLVIPMANFTLALFESTVSIPVLDLSQMMPVILGMLGLTASRTVEKVQGVQRDK